VTYNREEEALRVSICVTVARLYRCETDVRRRIKSLSVGVEETPVRGDGEIDQHQVD
jgi:hypothetical protein